MKNTKSQVLSILIAWPLLYGAIVVCAYLVFVIRDSIDQTLMLTFSTISASFLIISIVFGPAALLAYGFCSMAYLLYCQKYHKAMQPKILYALGPITLLFIVFIGWKFQLFFPLILPNFW